MKKTKQFLWVITLAVILTTTVIAITSSIDDTYMTFDIVDNQAILTSYTGNEKTINIPQTYNGYEVTTISTGAFNDYDIDKVYLPVSVTNVETNAFLNCGEINVFLELQDPNSDILQNVENWGIADYQGGIVSYTSTGKTYLQIVNKSNEPFGPQPEQPEDDQQFDDSYYEDDDYEYVGEEFNVYLTDIQSQIKNVYDASGVVKYDLDHQGDKISLYDGTNEVEYDKGISMAGGNVCITFTDLKMYGYEKFSANFGTHYIARQIDSQTTSFTYEVRLDGQSVYISDEFNAYTPTEYVEFDLTGHEVIQILVNTNGNTSGDYAAIGDPIFTKDSESPYIDVFDYILCIW